MFETGVVVKNLQDHLKDSRRTHILQAAAHVFAEKGFKAATIKDVARAAGMGDGTLYYHFENKHALLLGLLEHLTHNVQQTINPLDVQDLDLRTLLKTFLQHPLALFQGSHSELFKVMVSESLVNSEMASRFQQQILQPMLLGARMQMQSWSERHQRPLPHWSMPVLTALILGLLVQRMLGDLSLQEEWDQLPDLLADVLVKGLPE